MLIYSLAKPEIGLTANNNKNVAVNITLEMVNNRKLQYVLIAAASLRKSGSELGIQAVKYSLVLTAVQDVPDKWWQIPQKYVTSEDN